MTIINIILNLFGKRCLFGHKWKIGKESIEYTMVNISPLVSPIEYIHRIEDVRYCTRCSKKQRKAYSHIYINNDWTDWHLTKEEERDKKLNDLGL